MKKIAVPTSAQLERHEVTRLYQQFKRRYPESDAYLDAMFNSKATTYHDRGPLLRNDGRVCLVATKVLNLKEPRPVWHTWCGEVVDQPGYKTFNLMPTCLGCIANKE